MKREFLVQEVSAMTPFVRQVLGDLVAGSAEVLQWERRVELLKDCRFSERYDVRASWYDAKRELDRAERKVSDYVRELKDLGVVVVDKVQGVAGFPFYLAPRDNPEDTRKALFLLKWSDQPQRGIRTWRFANETKERLVPPSWKKRPVAMADST